MDHLRRVATVIRAARAGSFSKAARQLGISPQAVSNQVNQVERWLEVRLFNRSTRKISLTEEGAVFFERCTNGIDAIDEAINELRERKQEAVGTVRLTVPYGLSQALVVPLLPSLLERYPRVSVELLVQNEMPDIVEHAIDVGILGGALPMGSVVARKVATFDMILCASASYLRKHGTPRTVEELRNHRCVHLRDPRTGKIYPWRFQRGDQVTTIDVHAALTVNDTETHRRAVLNGAGIGQLASFFVARHFRANRLKPLLMGFLAPPIDIYLYLQRRAQQPKKNSVVADFLMEELRNHPDLQPLDLHASNRSRVVPARP
jgi:LysR family transcriptional regulator for bpeEF and oprC